MPRERSPDRDKAKKMWLDSGGAMKLKDIAAELGIGETQVRKWKSQDNWEASLKGNVTKQTNGNVTKQKNTTKVKKEDIKSAGSMDIGSDTELTDKQRLFVMEYLRDFNATRAAIAVGYSKKTAYAIGWENLRKPRIQAEIKRFKELKVNELGIDIQRIILEYLKIAFADVTDYLEFGQKEVPVMTMFGPAKDENGEPLMKVVNYVDFKESAEVDGTLISEVKQGKEGVSIKLHNKMKALEALEKYLDFMTEEQKLRIEKLRTEVAALKGDNGSTEDDGFLDALKGKVTEVWDDSSTEA
ncbi:terminase small subunit [Paenibacillus naphthalenovorans]|uniref:terminase small subunit n=1 Tax=Paenibacillus naphthalenovorans TaxID=162209 RepID=UPI003D275B1F